MPLIDTYTTPEGHTVDLWHNPTEPAPYTVDRRNPPPPSSSEPLGPITFSITGRNEEAMRDVFELWRPTP